MKDLNSFFVRFVVVIRVIINYLFFMTVMVKRDLFIKNSYFIAETATKSLLFLFLNHLSLSFTMPGRTNNENLFFGINLLVKLWTLIKMSTDFQLALL